MRYPTKLPLRALGLVAVGLLTLLLYPPLALASVHGPSTLVLPSTQVWVIVIGALVPLATYILNHVGPQVTEPVKAAVLVVVSAGAAALYTAATTSVIGWNTSTLQLLLTGVVGALASHHLLWKPSGVSTLLGAGTNASHHLKAPPRVAKPRAHAPKSG